ncbi:MAG: ArnT family glycosyltransferase [Salibacteraceae bacterium]
MRSLFTNDKWVYGLAGALLLPALFFNLDLMPLNADDGLRGLVALEMVYADEYLVPSNNGDLYYRKPPIFNWFIVLAHQLTGSFSNFTIRFPVGVSLLLFGATIVAFLRNTIGWRNAALVALLTMTSGHILFESSRVGRIDITYSWMIYTGFMVVYHYFRKGNWWGLFLVSYAVAALGFLTKGMPTVVFQGATLIAWLSISGHFKRLFSWQHLAGGVLFLIVVGSYYGIYEQRNPGGVVKLISALWTDSNERTVAHFSLGKTLGHIAVFPLKLLYEISPWCLLVIAWVRKGWGKQVRQQPLLWFSAVIFLANILIYWISPGSNTRYILMFFPLVALYLVWFYRMPAFQLPARNSIIDRIFQGLLVLLVAGVWWFAISDEFALAPHRLLWCAVLSLGFAGLAFLFYKMPRSRLVLMVCAVLLARISYNAMVRPVLDQTSRGVVFRDGAEEAADLSMGQELKVYGKASIFPEITIYFSRQREEILFRQRKNIDNNGTLYLIDQDQKARLEAARVTWTEKFQFAMSKHVDLYMVQFHNHPEALVGDGIDAVP